MILRIFADGRMAEIVIKTAKPIDADELVRMLTAHGVISAKIVKLNPATGEPEFNAAHNARKKFFDDKT